MSDSLQPHEVQHARPPCPSPTPGACSDSCPWVCDAIHPSHPLLSPSPPAFPNIRVFSMESVLRIRCEELQSTGAWTSASVLPMNIQDWIPLGLIGCISLQSKGLSRVFSNTTVQKHQFFSAQLSLWSNSHIHTLLLEKRSFDLCRQSNDSAF